jgi:hypothetical protein
MSFFSYPSHKKILFTVLLGVFLVTAGVVMASSFRLQADYTCDSMTDLDDYTTLVKEKRLSTRKLSLLFNEWGRRGVPDLEECKKASIVQNTTTENEQYNTDNESTNDIDQQNNNDTPADSDNDIPDTDIPSTNPVVNSAIDISDTDLIAYFPMEETSGKLINKKTSNAVANLNPMGQVTYAQTGKLGKGIKVNGTGNGFCSGSSSCSDVNIYDFSGSYTMGMWVKFDSYKGFLFRKWDEGAGNYSYWVLSHPHPDWLFGYGHGLRKNMPTGRSYVEGYMDLTKGSVGGWHQFTVVRDIAAKTVKLYVDGVLQDTHPGVLQEADGGTQTSEMRADNQNSADPFRLGELKGTIDEFFAYKRALTQEEVTTIYQSSL